MAAIPSLSSSEVSQLSRLHSPLLQLATFRERLLPPPENPLPSSDFDFISQHGEVVEDGGDQPNFQGARVPLKNVKINVDRMEQKLKAIGYTDLQFLTYLKYGWPIGDAINLGYEDANERTLSGVGKLYSKAMEKQKLVLARENRLSAYENYTFVDEFISKQIEAVKLAGPFSLETSPFPGVLPHVVSIKTKESAGKNRLILQPFLLNHHTPGGVYPDGAPAYPRGGVYDFTRLLARLAPGAWLWRRDLRTYYTQIPLDPRDYPKLR